MKNGSYIYSLKDKIIYNVLMFIKTSDQQYRILAIEQIKEFAKYYNLQCVKAKRYRLPLETALFNFIQNKIGYMETVNQMFSSI